MESQSQTKVDPRKQALLEARFFGGGRTEDFEVENSEPSTPPVIPMSLATSFAPAACQPSLQSSPMLIQPLPPKSSLPLGKIFSYILWNGFS
jgi:hypothetical protein